MRAPACSLVLLLGLPPSHARHASASATTRSRRGQRGPSQHVREVEEVRQAHFLRGALASSEAAALSTAAPTTPVPSPRKQARSEGLRTSNEGGSSQRAAQPLRGEPSPAASCRVRVRRTAANRVLQVEACKNHNHITCGVMSGAGCARLRRLASPVARPTLRADAAPAGGSSLDEAASSVRT